MLIFQDFQYLKIILQLRNCILIKGIPFDQTTRQEAVAKILKFFEQKEQKLVTTPNPEFIVESTKNPDFKKVLQKADLSVADGIGTLWASTYIEKVSLNKGNTGDFKKNWIIFATLFQTLFFPHKIRKVLPERVCGSDLFLDLCAQSPSKIFLLGAAEGIAEKTAKILKKKFPKIKIVGTHAGSPKESDEKEIVSLINNSKAELLFVAYGSPKQEFWIDRNLKKMHTVKVAMGIGGSFDFVAGTQKRAPGILRKIGLEWLWRLIREPKRFKRIWNATFVFISIIIKK